MIEITIPGELRGKGRPKFSTRGGFARAYTDAKTANAETWVRSCAIDQVGQPVMEGPLSVTLTVFVPVPKSWSKKRQVAALAGELRPTGRPDFDNVAKLVCDALNGIVWRDDAQITDVLFGKHYGATPAARLIVRSAGSSK